MYMIKEASCYKVVSVGELAGFDSPIHLCPWYSLRQRLAALLHICAAKFYPPTLSQDGRGVNVKLRATLMFFSSILKPRKCISRIPHYNVIWRHFSGQGFEPRVVLLQNPPWKCFAIRTHHSRQTDIHYHMLARNYGLLHPETGGKFFRSDCTLAVS